MYRFKPERVRPFVSTHQGRAPKGERCLEISSRGKTILGRSLSAMTLKPVGAFASCVRVRLPGRQGLRPWPVAADHEPGERVRGEAGRRGAGGDRSAARLPVPGGVLAGLDRGRLLQLALGERGDGPSGHACSATPVRQLQRHVLPARARLSGEGGGDSDRACRIHDEPGDPLAPGLDEARRPRQLTSSTTAAMTVVHVPDRAPVAPRAACRVRTPGRTRRALDRPRAVDSISAASRSV